jgi:hypothetical protein
LSTNRIGIAIPIFPCRSIDEQLDFYQALGSEVTYNQTKPNLYVCVRHHIVERSPPRDFQESPNSIILQKTEDLTSSMRELLLKKQIIYRYLIKSLKK